MCLACSTDLGTHPSGSSGVNLVVTQMLSTCCLVSCVHGSAGEPLAPVVPTAGDLHVEGNPAVWNTFDELPPGVFGSSGHYELSPLDILLLGQWQRVRPPHTSRTRRLCWRTRLRGPFCLRWRSARAQPLQAAGFVLE